MQHFSGSRFLVFELMSFLSLGHICHPTVQVRVKPSISMNSGDPWLQVLEMAFPQEMPLFLTNFNFVKVDFASQPYM